MSSMTEHSAIKAGLHSEGSKSFSQLCCDCSRIDFSRLPNHELLITKDNQTSSFKAIRHADATDNSLKSTRVPSDEDSYDSSVTIGSLRAVFSRQDHCAFCDLVILSICTQCSVTVDAIRECDDEHQVTVFTSDKGRITDTGHFSLQIVFPRAVMGERGLAFTMIHRLSEEVVPFLGRYNQSNDIDFDLLRKWVHTPYPSDTQTVAHGGLNSESLVIDVQRGCLVKPMPTSRYLALSYVWGKGKTLQTVKANVEALKRPYSLDPTDHRLPKTIRDCICLMKKIDERYLWVDALCIVQDDTERKMIQIAAMGDIYRGAVTVIVAAHGSDVDAGLPGVHPDHRRTWRQHSREIRGIPLANRRVLPFMSKSTWATRAWTYQELLLARRCLVFTSEQVYFRHEGGIYEEDIHEGIVDTDREPIRLNPDELYRNLDYTLNRVNFSRYTLMVHRYSGRKLTYSMDIFNAFAGIETLLRPSFRSDFLYGLPLTELTVALLWRPDSDACRRVNPDTGLPVFPSWSWAGWQGRVSWDPYYPYEHWERVVWIDPKTEEEFLLEDLRGFNDEEMPRWSKQQVAWFPEDDVASWHGHCFLECNSRDILYLHPIAPEGSKHRPSWTLVGPGSSLLTFKAWSAFFDVAHEKVNFIAFGILNDDTFECANEDNGDEPYHGVCPLAVKDVDGFLAGVVRVPGSVVQELALPGRYEFIALARSIKPGGSPQDLAVGAPPFDDGDVEDSRSEIETAPEPFDALFDCFDTNRYDGEKPWSVYDVLMISQDGDVSYRLGVGTVHVDAFGQADTCTRRLVKLG